MGGRLDRTSSAEAGAVQHDGSRLLRTASNDSSQDSGSTGHRTPLAAMARLSRERIIGPESGPKKYDGGGITRTSSSESTARGQGVRKGKLTRTSSSDSTMSEADSLRAGLASAPPAHAGVPQRRCLSIFTHALCHAAYNMSSASVPAHACEVIMTWNASAFAQKRRDRHGRSSQKIHHRLFQNLLEIPGDAREEDSCRWVEQCHHGNSWCWPCQSENQMKLSVPYQADCGHDRRRIFCALPHRPGQQKAADQIHLWQCRVLCRREQEEVCLALVS